MMVEKLFEGRPPRPGSRVLDPGSGRGVFVDGILRWCDRHACAAPSITAVESDAAHVAVLNQRFADREMIRVRHADFLAVPSGSFDFVIGNPPYVPISGLSEDERRRYRAAYLSARGRFDLYLLFFEQALKQLRPGGRLVFVTPEKYLYVETASSLRRLLASHWVKELQFLGEETFPGLVTYPLVTTIEASVPDGQTRVTERDGARRTIARPATTSSWMPLIRGAVAAGQSLTLSSIATRISCGIATGADSVFVVPAASVTGGLAAFAHPSLAGREINGGALPPIRRMLLAPYDRDGRLLPEHLLGELYDHLSRPQHRQRLIERTCVRSKPWYAFHETPPFRDLLRPKILCKDIGAKPVFMVDREGDVVPRHSAYYVVPRDGCDLEALAEYLNSATAHDWLRDHCQRAANGFLRVQSHVLRHLPIPAIFGTMPRQIELAMEIATRRSA